MATVILYDVKQIIPVGLTRSWSVEWALNEKLHLYGVGLLCITDLLHSSRISLRSKRLLSDGSFAR